MAEANTGAPKGSGAGDGGAAAAAAAASKNGFPSWASQLPESVRTHESIKGFKDLGSWAVSNIAREEKARSAIYIPGKDASDEDRAKFYQALGRPETPDKYDLAIPTERKVDEKFVGAAREIFHNLGLTAQQGKELASFWLAQEDAAVAQFVETQKLEHQAHIDELKGEWGHAYDRNLATAGRALAQFCTGGDGLPAIPGLAELCENPLFKDHPALTRLMYEFGKMMGEDSAIEGDPALDKQAHDDLEKEIRAMRMDPSHKLYKALHDSNDPQHKSAVEKMRELYDQRFGTEAQRPGG
jgi:hypothetical protein